MKIQITMFHKENKYRPIATVIEVDSMADFKENQKEYVKKAISKIAQQRYRTPQDLYKTGYTIYRYRPYASEDRKKAFVENFFKNKSWQMRSDML